MDAEAYLAILLPLARGENGSDNAPNRTSAVAVISASIQGMTNTEVAPHLQLVADTMVQPGLCESDDKTLQNELSSLCLSIVQT